MPKEEIAPVEEPIIEPVAVPESTDQLPEYANWVKSIHAAAETE